MEIVEDETRNNELDKLYQEFVEQNKPTPPEPNPWPDDTKPGEDNPGGDDQGENTPGGDNQGENNSGGDNQGGNNSGGDNLGAAQGNSPNVGSSEKDNTVSDKILPYTSDIAIGAFIVTMIVSLIGIIYIVRKKNKK